MSSELMIKMILACVMFFVLKRMVVSILYFIDPLKTEQVTNAGLLKNIEHSNNLINDLSSGVGWWIIRFLAILEILLFGFAVKLLIGLW